MASSGNEMLQDIKRRIDSNLKLLFQLQHQMIVRLTPSSSSNTAETECPVLFENHVNITNKGSVVKNDMVKASFADKEYHEDNCHHKEEDNVSEDNFIGVGDNYLYVSHKSEHENGSSYIINKKRRVMRADHSATTKPAALNSSLKEEKLVLDCNKDDHEVIPTTTMRTQPRTLLYMEDDRPAAEFDEKQKQNRKRKRHAAMCDDHKEVDKNLNWCSSSRSPQEEQSSCESNFLLILTNDLFHRIIEDYKVLVISTQAMKQREINDRMKTNLILNHIRLVEKDVMGGLLGKRNKEQEEEKLRKNQKSCTGGVPCEENDTGRADFGPSSHLLQNDVYEHRSRRNNVEEEEEERSHHHHNTRALSRISDPRHDITTPRTTDDYNEDPPITMMMKSRNDELRASTNISALMFPSTGSGTDIPRNDMTYSEEGEASSSLLLPAGRRPDAVAESSPNPCNDFLSSRTKNNNSFSTWDEKEQKKTVGGRGGMILTRRSGGITKNAMIVEDPNQPIIASDEEKAAVGGDSFFKHVSTGPTRILKNNKNNSDDVVRSRGNLIYNSSKEQEIAPPSCPIILPRTAESRDGDTTSSTMVTSSFASSASSTSSGNLANDEEDQPHCKENKEKDGTSILDTSLSSVSVNDSEDSDSIKNQQAKEKSTSTTSNKLKEREWMPLGTSDDVAFLSDFLCFIRSECVEVFAATKYDVDNRSKSKKVQVGQVGIRCRFCANLPYERRKTRSSNFPSSIDQLYVGVSMMMYKHFPLCEGMPESIRQKIENLRTKTKTREGRATREYWIHSAKSLGMVETPPQEEDEEGNKDNLPRVIRFKDPLE